MSKKKLCLHNAAQLLSVYAADGQCFNFGDKYWCQPLVRGWVIVLCCHFYG